MLNQSRRILGRLRWNAAMEPLPSVEAPQGLTWSEHSHPPQSIHGSSSHLRDIGSGQYTPTINSTQSAQCECHAACSRLLQTARAQQQPCNSIFTVRDASFWQAHALAACFCTSCTARHHAWTQPPASSWHAHRRCVSTLTKAGVPKPRPEVETAMSTAKGGHIARLIYFSQTLKELDSVLYKHRDSLHNTHWAAAALQLERLYRQERSSPFALRVKGLASRIESAAVATAPRLAVIHLSSIIRGLTGASHALAPDSLSALAGVLLVRDAAQLRLASDTQWKHLVWGFSMQGYGNRVFWRELSDVAVRLMSSWDPNRVASVLKNMTMMGVRNQDLAVTAMQTMMDKVSDMKPYPIADALYALVCVAPHNLDLTHKCITALAEQGAQQLYLFDAKCCALFLSSLARLSKADSDLSKVVVPKELAARVATAALLSPTSAVHPLYAKKLLIACKALGYQDSKVTAGLAALTLPMLDTVGPTLRQELLQVVLDSMERAGELEEVKQLKEAVELLGDAAMQ